MKILEHIAQDIVEKTSEILEHPISITDNEGIIIGSTDKSRIGIFHQPSLEVIKKNAMVVCKNEVEKKVLPGVSAPLKFNNKIIGVLGIVGDPSEVEKYVQLVKNQVEMMCQEAFRKEMIELKDKMLEMFVHQLVHYKESDRENNSSILQYANLLEFNHHAERVCLLIEINHLSDQLTAKKENDELFGNLGFQYFQKEVLSFLQLMFQENKDDIVSFLHLDQYIVIQSLPYKKSFANLIDKLPEKQDKLNLLLETKYRASARISVGNVGNSLGGIAESFQNAAKAMSIGRRFEPDSSIHVYNELETLLRMLPNRITPEFQNKLLKMISPLIEQDNYDVLASTFLGYCKYNMNLSVASRNLFIHRNTIIYRLEKISEISSLNTNSFEHCMLLYTAIQCYEESKLS